MQKTLHTRTLLKRDLSSLPQETFQFPSNGKAYTKDIKCAVEVQLDMFQFPSNGKAYLNQVYT